MNNNIIKFLEDKLRELKEIEEQIRKRREEADKELKKIKSKYSKIIQEKQKEFREKEKEFLKFVRKHKGEIFKDSDSVNLKTGSLYLRIRKVVKRVRTVTVELLKKLGYHEAIKIEESVDWNEIEKWPDEKIIAIGSERITKEEIQYQYRG